MPEGFDVVGPQPKYATEEESLRGCGYRHVGHCPDEPSFAQRDDGPPPSAVSSSSIQPQQDKTMAVECRFTLVVVGHERDALKAAAAAERILRTGLHEPGLALSASINVYNSQDADGG